MCPPSKSSRDPVRDDLSFAISILSLLHPGPHQTKWVGFYSTFRPSRVGLTHR